MNEKNSNPATKKQTSYTYWVDDKNKSRQLPPEHQPKKIEVPLQTSTSTNKDGPSAWNSLGTWEEKKISISDFEAQLTPRLKQWLEKQQQIAELLLGQIKLEGEIHKIYKRSKWNVMYQIKGSIEFKMIYKGEDEQKEKKGKVKLIELTDQGDREFEVKGDSDVKKKINAGRADTVVKIVEEVLSGYKN